MEVERSMIPVDAFSVNPAVELYVPPLVNPPEGTGTGFVPLEQTEAPLLYVNPVTGAVTGLIVMLAVPVPAAVQPDAATE